MLNTGEKILVFLATFVICIAYALPFAIVVLVISDIHKALWVGGLLTALFFVGNVAYALIKSKIRGWW